MTVGTRSEALKQKAHNEFKDFLVIALYLWVISSFFVLYKSVILNESISSVAHGTALNNALVLGVFVFIARVLHLGDQADEAAAYLPDSPKGGLVFHRAGRLQDSGGNRRNDGMSGAALGWIGILLANQFFGSVMATTLIPGYAQCQH